MAHTFLSVFFISTEYLATVARDKCCGFYLALYYHVSTYCYSINFFNKTPGSKILTRLSALEKIQPHWWLKTSAGLILGLTLSYALIGTFAWYGPGGIDAAVKVQFNMWMISPIWLTILTFSYLFKTGLKAIIYLGSANIIAYAIFFFLRWY